MSAYIGPLLLEGKSGQSENQVDHGQHHDEEDHRHAATDPHKICHAVTTGAYDQGIDLVGGQILCGSVAACR